MNPQMNKVFSKLAKEDKKTELASEKVELALLDDVKKTYKAVTNLRKKAEEDLAKSKRSAIMGDSMIKEFKADANKVEKLAKELGIPVKDINLQQLVKEVDSAEKQFDAIIKA